LARLCARRLKKKMGFVVCVHDGFRRQSLRRIAYRIARVLQKERA
jgi:hypothetical protein